MDKTDVRKKQEELVAQVVVEVPNRNVDKMYDYIIPNALQEKVVQGSRVIVSFGSRKIQGYVLKTTLMDISDKKLKQIDAVADEHPPLTPELIKLGEWMSTEYICVRIMVLQAMLPSVLKSKTLKKVEVTEDGHQKVTYQVQDKITHKHITIVETVQNREELEKFLLETSQQAKKQRQVVDYLLHNKQKISLAALLEDCQTTRSVIQTLASKGILRLNKEEVRRNPYAGRTFARTEALQFTTEQQVAYDQIIKKVEHEEYSTFLLHGVTGSGKTEIYLQSIAHVLKKGKEAIVLVPEISLTPQMVQRFKGRFGDQVAVIHSRLSAGERYDEWRKIQEQEVNVVIGARSALFAPFKNLGIIIIDEEHENSYKQDETPRYHARDIAIFRGQYHQAPVILGSATPTLESFARAQKNVYHLLTLKERVYGQALPKMNIVDMREELRQGNRSMFSELLSQHIQQCLDRKEQMVLFLNRRGFSTFVMCRDCGYVLGCPHCDISLTYHKVNHTHRCHYCGFTGERLHSCPECASEHIRFFGTGTQKVEEELHKRFPGIRVIRMDVDTTGKKGSHEKWLNAFGDHQADCLLGTQMIAKGLDFEKVTLVGVLAADSLLHLPDFRSAEKTFQLITQVSGRAGRHELPGEVVIQSYTPDHYSIQHAANHDYLAFYDQEMTYRQKRGYPPYYYLTLVTFSHADLIYLVKVAEQSTTWLKQHLSAQTYVLGPVASPIPKIKDRYRYHCMIKYRNEQNLNHILAQFMDISRAVMQKEKVQIQIDRQPQMLM